jgi:hypothetical protein
MVNIDLTEFIGEFTITQFPKKLEELKVSLAEIAGVVEKFAGLLKKDLGDK